MNSLTVAQIVDLYIDQHPELDEHRSLLMAIFKERDETMRLGKVSAAEIMYKLGQFINKVEKDTGAPYR